MLIDITILIAGTFASIAVHELGHVVTARALGAKAAFVSIGFGPQVFSYKDCRGTHWILKLLPLGGCFGYHESSLPAHLSFDVPDGARSYTQGHSISKRAAIYISGSFFNVVFSLATIAFALLSNGFNFYYDQNVDAYVLISGFSLALALFNLMPVLPLDGGRLSLLIYETVAGKPISQSIERYLSSLGTLIILLTTLVIVFFLIKHFVS